MKLLILTITMLLTKVSSESYNISEIVYFKCNDSVTDCSNHGTCNNDRDDCDCFASFTTHFEDGVYFSQTPRCNYEQKNQIYAFILCLFVSFGATHFYLGNYTVGYTQLMLFLFILILNILTIYKLSIKHLRQTTASQLKQSLSLGVIITFITFIFLMWYIFDIFMIVFAIYKDANNVEMFQIIL